MRNRSLRQCALLLSLLILVSLCVVEAGAQTRRKRRPRRVVRPVITNPVITPPATEQQPANSEEKIISTADENSNGPDQVEGATSKKSKSTRKTADEADMQQTLNVLSNQVNRLNDKLSQMQENDRTLIEMERLTRAEQRAESLRSQLVDGESKLADLQSKLEQVEYAVKPENIERATATFGTVHPEEAREARRRQLENEKARLQAQLRILETSRTRLETALQTADAEVDRLRRRLEQQEDESDSTNTEQRRSSSRPKPE